MREQERRTARSAQLSCPRGGGGGGYPVLVWVPLSPSSLSPSPGEHTDKLKALPSRGTSYVGDHCKHFSFWI